MGWRSSSTSGSRSWGGPTTALVRLAPDVAGPLDRPRGRARRAGAITPWSPRGVRPGVVSLLDQAEAAGVPVGVASSSSRSTGCGSHLGRLGVLHALLRRPVPRSRRAGQARAGPLRRRADALGDRAGSVGRARGLSPRVLGGPRRRVRLWSRPTTSRAPRLPPCRPRGRLPGRVDWPGSTSGGRGPPSWAPPPGLPTDPRRFMSPDPLRPPTISRAFWLTRDTGGGRTDQRTRPGWGRP